MIKETQPYGACPGCGGFTVCTCSPDRLDVIDAIVAAKPKDLCEVTGVPRSICLHGGPETVHAEDLIEW